LGDVLLSELVDNNQESVDVLVGTDVFLVGDNFLRESSALGDGSGGIGKVNRILNSSNQVHLSQDGLHRGFVGLDFSSNSLSSFEVHLIKVKIILLRHVETHLLDLREKHHFDHAIFENVFSDWEFLSLTSD
jgi:hypothetical protein